MNIEYIFLKLSALQFRRDLTDINKSLNLLSIQEVLAVISYMDSIKFKMKTIEEQLAKRLIEDEK